MKRATHIQSILQSIGNITREFNTRGNYPFRNYSLGRSHMDILFLLSQKECSIKQLSHYLNVTSSAVTQFVDYLETKDLVYKTEDPLDRRSRLVSLTLGSESEVRAFELEYIREMEVKFVKLGDEDLAQLNRILNKIRST